MKYDTIPSADVIERTANAIRGRGVEVFVVTDRAEALAKIQELIPKGASINNGASRTLEEIGFVEYVKSDITQI